MSMTGGRAVNHVDLLFHSIGGNNKVTFFNYR
jgi:hypothetical protein